MKPFIKIITLVMVLVRVGPAAAQKTAGDTLIVPNPVNYTPSMFGIVVKLVFAMALIVGLIYLSTYFLKRLNSQGRGAASLGDVIKVMGRTFIAPKQCLYIVKIGEKYAILGATDSSINYISELSPQDIEKYVRPGTPGKDSVLPRAKFGDILKGIIKP